MKSMTELPVNNSSEPAKGLIGQLLAALERGRHERDVRRLKAHIAWTPEQRANLSGRPQKRR